MNADELREALEMAAHARRNMEMMDRMPPTRNLRWDTALEISRVESTVGSERTRTGRVLHLLSRELERDWIAPFIQGGDGPHWREKVEKWERDKAACLAAEPLP